jgi:hypothetical protein
MASDLPQISVSSVLRYREDGRQHRAGGRIADGVCTRLTDGTLKSDRFTLSTSSTDRDLEVSFSAPLQLPGLMAALAQAAPPVDESPEEFEARLAFHDELARAFDKAAQQLRRLPRT